MWTQRNSWFTAALVISALLAGPTAAQDPFSLNTNPWGEDDFEYFAPVDIDGYGHSQKPRLGWYGEIGYMNLYMAQPDQILVFERRTNDLGLPVVGERVLNPGGGNFNDGTRVDFGYFADWGGGRATGWLGSVSSVGGATMHNVVTQQRLGRINNTDGNQGNNQFPNGNDNAGSPVFPLQDRNNWETGAMDWYVAIAINRTDINGFELNKSFRLAPLHYGATIEPFFGMRYIQIDDYTQRDAYERLDGDGAPLPFPSSDDAEIEQLFSEVTEWTNRAVVGQLGVRLSRNYGAFHLSGDFRAFAGPNFQEYTLYEDFLEVNFGGNGDDTLPISERYDRNLFTADLDEILIGTEIRTQAAYHVTRDIALSVGAELLGFGRGVARSNLFDNDQALWSIGYTLGVEIRR